MKNIQDVNAPENLMSMIRQTEKYCIDCDRHFPFWLTRNTCPYCGSEQTSWVSPGQDADTPMYE